MKITYDKNADVFAVYFSNKIPDDTVPMESSRIHMSIDKKSRPIAIEILEASKMLPKNVLTTKDISLLKGV
jgi:uncharacterized protein YuzE